MPDYPCPMHGQLEHKVDAMHEKLEHKIDAIHEDIRSMLERMGTFQTAVAVHGGDLAQLRKDIDALGSKNQSERSELAGKLDALDVRVRHIESMVDQFKGVRVTLKILWVLFGAYTVAGLFALYFKG